MSAACAGLRSAKLVLQVAAEDGGPRLRYNGITDSIKLNTAAATAASACRTERVQLAWHEIALSASKHWLYNTVDVHVTGQLLHVLQAQDQMLLGQP